MISKPAHIYTTAFKLIMSDLFLLKFNIRFIVNFVRRKSYDDVPPGRYCSNEICIYIRNYHFQIGKQYGRLKFAKNRFTTVQLFVVAFELQRTKIIIQYCCKVNEHTRSASCRVLFLL